MSAVPGIIDKLVNTDNEEEVAQGMGQLLMVVPASVSLSSVLRDTMGPYLTHTDPHVRRRATSVLGKALQTSSADMCAADPAVAASLLSFFTSRLADYPSVGGCLIALVSLFTKYGGLLADTAAKEVSAAVFKELHVPAMEQQLRFWALTLLDTLVQDERWGPSLVDDAVGFATGYVQAMEAEKDPRCLVVALRVAAATLRSLGPTLATVPGGDDMLDELFDVTACYFPITFTPPPNDPHGITKELLVSSLRSVFKSTPLLGPFVFPLLLEKLSSTIVSAKVDALETMRECVLAYGEGKALSKSLRSCCDALRGEVVHGSDPRLVTLALAAITAFSQVLSTHARGDGAGDGNWPMFLSTLLRTSVVELERAPTSLIGRASAKVLVAVAAASPFTLASVLDSVLPHIDRALAMVDVEPDDIPMSGLVTAPPADEADPAARREAMVTFVADLLHTTPPDIHFPSSSHPLKPHVFRLWEPLLSVVVAPGSDASAAGTQAHAVKALTDLASRPPTPIVSPADVTDLLSNLVALYTSDGTPVPVQEAVATGLASLAARPAFETAVADCIPKFVDMVSSSPAGVDRSLTVLQQLCVTPHMFDTVLPCLAKLSLDESVTPVALKVDAVATKALTTAAAVVTAMQGHAKCMDACFASSAAAAAGESEDGAAQAETDPPSGSTGLPFLSALLCAVLSSSPAVPKSALDACKAVLQAVLLGASPSTQSAVRTTIESVFLGSGDSLGALGGVVLTAFQPLSSPAVVTSTIPFLTTAVGSAPASRPGDVCDLLLGWLMPASSSRSDASVPGPAPGSAPAPPGTSTGTGGAGAGAGSSQQADVSAPEVATVTAQCLGALLNRLALNPEAKALAKRVVLDTLLPVVSDTTAPTVARLTALEGVIWGLKGLQMAGHRGPAVRPVLEALCDLTLDSTAGLEADGLPPVSEAAAQGFGTLLADTLGCLSSASGATIKPLYKQRVFSTSFPRLVNDRVPGALPPAVLLAVSSMTASLPSRILFAELPRLLPVILVALGNPHHPAVRISALSTFEVLVSQAVADITPHLGTVTPKLLALTTFPGRPKVRAAALGCLTAFTKLPYPKLHPLRSSVVRGLVPALGDPKRAVRRRAAFCRNEWITLSTTPA